MGDVIEANILLPKLYGLSTQWWIKVGLRICPEDVGYLNGKYQKDMFENINSSYWTELMEQKWEDELSVSIGTYHFIPIPMIKDSPEYRLEVKPPLTSMGNYLPPNI